MFPFPEHTTNVVPRQFGKKIFGWIYAPREATIIAITVCAFVFIVYGSEPGPTVLAVTCPSTATPVQLGSALTHAKTFVFMGFKANRTTNTSNVWILSSSVNDSPGIPLAPGQIISVTSYKTQDASDFWIDAETANDGVVVWVQDRP